MSCSHISTYMTYIRSRRLDARLIMNYNESHSGKVNNDVMMINLKVS